MSICFPMSALNENKHLIMRGINVKATHNCVRPGPITEKTLPCEQKFLSCMAFSVYEVIRVACLSRTNDFVNAKSHAREKPLLAG